MDTIIYYVLTALAVIITLSIHEYCHGYVAYKLGDSTAKSLGRLTLNPIRHLDPLGALCMLFFHFGWAKPVPINPRYFKNPKRDFAITAIAGPVSNLIVALFSAFVYVASFKLLSGIQYQSTFTLSLAQNALSFLYIFHIVNIGLAIFNLIPVPPLDGSRLLNVILPQRVYFKIMEYEQTIYFILIGWLLLGGYASSFLLSFAFVAQNPLLHAIANFLSLSGMLSRLIDLLSGLMLGLFKLIPFLQT